MLRLAQAGIAIFGYAAVFLHRRLTVLFLITSGDEYERPLHMQVATPSGFEPLTYRLGGGCSILLSYGADDGLYYGLNTPVIHRKIGIDGSVTKAPVTGSMPRMRWPAIVRISRMTRSPREPIEQLQLLLGEAGEQDTCVGGSGAAGKLCVDTPFGEAARG